ncbi:MAG: hypothetical protein VCB26_11905 [Candidatus Hydrogenedentota bacterium]
MSEPIPRRNALAMIGTALAGAWTAAFTGLTGIIVLNPLRGRRAIETI